MEDATERSCAAEEGKCTSASILVVDDNQGIRASLSAVLAMMGFQVTQAEDGDEALALVSRKNFGIVFTDLEMPGMDGFTLALNIKRSSPETPVIMITGCDRRVLREKMKNGCVDSVLFKPFNLEDIDKSVKGALIGRFVSHTTDLESGKALRGG